MISLTNHRGSMAFFFFFFRGMVLTWPDFFNNGGAISYKKCEPMGCHHFFTDPQNYGSPNLLQLAYFGLFFQEILAYFGLFFQEILAYFGLFWLIFPRNLQRSDPRKNGPRKNLSI